MPDAPDEATEQKEPRADTPPVEPDADPGHPSDPRAAEGGGFGESEIPDPMPAALQERTDQSDTVEAMEGESPSG